MKPKAIFELVVRIVGLFGILYVVRYLSRVIHRTGTPHYDHPLFLIGELGLILIGVYMVFGAPLLMDVLFPKDSDKPDEKPQDKS